MEEVPLRLDGLQLAEDRRFQERFWTAERVAWGVFSLVLAAALAGLTGAGGVLSNATRQVGDARIAYPAISRWTASDTLSIEPGAAETLAVRLGPDFLDGFEIETVWPEPASSVSTPEGLRLQFRVEGEAAAPITLGLQARKAGRVRYEVAVNGTTASLSTLILP